MGKIIVIMGAPGAGKGTQARLLSEKFGYPQISTGDILREMSQAETPLGRELKEILTSGRLVSDEVLAEVILERTSRADLRKGLHPRRLSAHAEQAQLLEELAGRQGHSVLLLRVTVHEDTLLKRLTGPQTLPAVRRDLQRLLQAAKTNGLVRLDGATLVQRADDNEEKVSTRLQAYRESTVPLFEFYGQSGRMIEIDGERPVEENFQRAEQIAPGYRGVVSGSGFMVIRKSSGELGKMRQAGLLVAETLRDLRRMVEPGITTRELDAYAENKIRAAGAYPTFKGYRGFPASICASLNDEVVHGIPSTRKLREGDIIKLIGARR
jgi:adenylate kinase